MFQKKIVSVICDGNFSDVGPVTSSPVYGSISSGGSDKRSVPGVSIFPTNIPYLMGSQLELQTDFTNHLIAWEFVSHEILWMQEILQQLLTLGVPLKQCKSWDGNTINRY